MFGDLRVFVDVEGNLVKWSYVELLEKIQTEEGLKLGNKLTRQHINYKLQKMKVRLAVQVISASVGNALRFLNLDLKLPEFVDCEATVNFILLFDQFFDLCNSRNPFAKGSKAVIREGNKGVWLELIERVENYILNLKCENGVPLYKTARRCPYFV